MILDIYAGGGGWDIAAQRLGLDPLGIETDDGACATRRAAGLTTDQHDVSRWMEMYEPNLVGVEGLIASPPCQTFSMAGKGAGRVALEQVLLGVKRVAAGEPIPYDEYDDIRTGLVLEPLRYALELEPEWLAWEQVPTVQPVWDACADVLRADGYSVWTGHLHAEQYGVPQTRKRSVLIASRVREMSQPPVTHSRFYSRNPTKLDEGVAKWVSMAEALGVYDKQPTTPLPDWCHNSPAPTVAGDPRIAPRGCKHPQPGCCSKWNGTPGLQFGPGTVRVTVQEAAILQSFPADYPWQGSSKTKQYQQVGNACPPLLALHILKHVTGAKP